MQRSALALRANLHPAIRREKADGRNWLVVPVVMLVQGVHNRTVYLGSEMARSVPTWNGRPVTIGHPMDEGGFPIPANSPAVLESQCVGYLYNSRFRVKGRTPRLTAEAWVDEAKAAKLSDGSKAALREIKSFKEGDPGGLEVSTGLYLMPSFDEGEMGGEPFDSVAHEISGDHLALLPGELGACSWSDGCGAPRVNSIGGIRTMTEKKKPPVQGNNSRAGFFSALAAWLSGNQDGDCGCSGPEAFNAQETVAALISNEKAPFGEGDRKSLEAMSEKTLKAMGETFLSDEDPQGEPAADPPEDPSGDPPDTDPGQQAAPEADPQGDPPQGEPPPDANKWEALVSQAPDDVQQFFKDMTGWKQGRRQALESRITANSALTAEGLASFSLEQLEALARDLAPADYSGRAGGRREERNAPPAPPKPWTDPKPNAKGQPVN